MAIEQFANEASTTVGGSGITSGGTSLIVASATGFPSSGNFRIKIDSEYLKVTGVSGTTFTVARGDGGSSADAHSVGAGVYCVVTKEALESMITINSAGSLVSTRRCFNFVSGATVTDNSGTGAVDITVSGGGGIPWEDAVTAPVLANFSWLNQGSATAITTSKGGIFLTTPAAANNNIKFLGLSPPGASWTAIMRSSVMAFNVNYHSAGFMIYDSGTSKLMAFGLLQNQLVITKYTNSTTFSATPFLVTLCGWSTYTWWKFVYSGGTVTWYHSVDGESWVQVTSVSFTAWSATVSQIGFYVEANNATYPIGLLLESWATTSP